jgi:hypothetical protein
MFNDIQFIKMQSRTTIVTHATWKRNYLLRSASGVPSVRSIFLSLFFPSSYA